MSSVDILELAAGILLVLTVLYDLFQSVVLPRPAVGRLRIAPQIVRRLWRIWRWTGCRWKVPAQREGALAAFGPAALLVLLATWACAALFGYGLILHVLRGQIGPHPPGFGTAMYFSAVSMLTIGFGDVVPVGAAARVVVIIEAATGLGLVALVISLLFSLYGSFQRREVAVIALDGLAGAPPSGVHLLETCAMNDMGEHLAKIFNDWTQWSAEVLESHLAYPILVYFRSSHDNEAWLNSFGAMMDAATIVITTVEDGPRGLALLLFRVGNHLVEDLNSYFRLPSPELVGIDREEFEEARRRLASAGYRLRPSDAAWSEFSRLRAQYAIPLNQLAQLLAVIPAQWIGDRSYLPHRRP